MQISLGWLNEDGKGERKLFISRKEGYLRELLERCGKRFKNSSQNMIMVRFHRKNNKQQTKKFLPLSSKY